jgi:hypothetical protein
MTTCSLESPKPRQASCTRFSSALARGLRAARPRIRPPGRSGAAAMRSRVRPHRGPAPHGSLVSRQSSAPRRSPNSARRYMFDTGVGQDLSARTLESDLRCLSDWQRQYLPNVHSPLGQQILAWLIRNRDQPKPFSHLLVSTSFSPTCVRQLLNQFAVLGLVEVPKAPVSCRRGNIVATPKLQERLEEYAECIKGIISHHRGIGSNSSQSVRAIQNLPLHK